jgi:hypothetical protein
MKEKTFLDLFMESAVVIAPVVYIALVIAEIAGIPAVSALGGLVFFAGIPVGSALLGAVVATIRVRVRR